MGIKELLEAVGYGEVVTRSGLALLAAMSLLEVAPVKINPWSWLFKMLKWIWQAFCRSLNAEVLKKLTEVEKAQNDVKEKLSVYKLK